MRIKESIKLNAQTRRSCELIKFALLMSAVKVSKTINTSIET